MDARCHSHSLVNYRVNREIMSLLDCKSLATPLNCCCALIIAVSSLVISTLDVSSPPLLRIPKPTSDGAPRFNPPASVENWYLVFPNERRPLGFENLPNA